MPPADGFAFAGPTAHQQRMHPKSADFVGQDSALVGIHPQGAFQWWNGPLVAILALADTTGNPDRFKGRVVVGIKVVGIDQLVCMGDLAAQTDGISAHGCGETTARFRDVSRQAQVPYAIRRFRQLA